MSDELVSVIIPAFNAAATVDETLRSVRAQTHEKLEILVVDDGSKDATADIVGRHAASDDRIRLILQPNGGVARARNRGIAEASADLIAPVDADDLWAPTKIAKQLTKLDAGGEDTALIYTWFAVIDEHSRVVDATNGPIEEGDVLQRMCMGNLVGNGSSPLMRKRVVLDMGAYEPALRDRDAQGCEDLLLYFRISERYRFGVVREHLTGYRQTPMNMSSNSARMLRSWHIVAAEMRARHPEYRREVELGEFYLIWWLMGRARASGQSSAALKLLARAGLRHPRDTAWMLFDSVRYARTEKNPRTPYDFLAHANGAV